MKMFLIEAIKRVKRLTEEINAIISLENKSCKVTYRTPEEIMDNNYDFWETRKAINDKMEEIIKLKRAINKANNEVKIGVDDLTISDALVKISLINKELNYHLSSMATSDNVSTYLDYKDGIVYTKILYDLEECSNYVEEKKDLLTKIQIGIDKANIITEIEI